MTQIVVARRDGILREPDGTQHRVHRGRTLADAAHPAVENNPDMWAPMAVELTVGTAATAGEPVGPHEPGAPAGAADRINQLENDLAEVEELAEHRGAELVRLANALAARRVTLPADEDRTPGWLVDLVCDVLDSATLPTPEVAAPPRPRARKQAAPHASDS